MYRLYNNSRAQIDVFDSDGTIRSIQPGGSADVDDLTKSMERAIGANLAYAVDIGVDPDLTDRKETWVVSTPTVSPAVSSPAQPQVTVNTATITEGARTPTPADRNMVAYSAGKMWRYTSQGRWTEITTSNNQEADVADYATRVDEAGNVTYVGHATPGSTEGQPVWRIKRITDTGGDLDIKYASGTATFTHSWANRTNLAYS